MIQAIVLTPFFTGVRMFSVFNPGYYRHGLGIGLPCDYAAGLCYR